MSNESVAAPVNEEAQLEALWQTFAASPAQLTLEEMESIERAAQADGFFRRLGFGMLSRSGAELVEAFGAGADRDSAALGAQAVAQVDAYRERLATLSEMMQAAAVRVSMALAEREDMHELLAEARTT